MEIQDRTARYLQRQAGFLEQSVAPSAYSKREIPRTDSGIPLSKGYMQEAAALYETLVQKEPDQAETWQKLGFAYQKNKLYEKAVNAYQQADLIKPDHLWTLKHLAHCYKLSGDFSKATQVFQRVLAFDPDNLNTLMQVGQCLAAQKEYAEAIKLFFKVEFLESHPEKARAPSAGVTSCLGNTKKQFECTRNCWHWKNLRQTTG